MNLEGWITCKGMNIMTGKGRTKSKLNIFNIKKTVIVNINTLLVIIYK